MTGTDGDGGQAERSLDGATARDRTPTAADIDRGAIGSIGDNARTNLMRGGAFAAVAAVIGIFFITQSESGKGDTRTEAEKRAAATPVKAVVDYAQVAPRGSDNPRLAGTTTDPGAPNLNGEEPAGQTVPALSPDDPGAAQADRGGRRDPSAVIADAKRRAPILAYGGAGARGESGGSAMGYPSSPRSDDRNEPTELDRLRRQSTVKQSRASVLPNRDYLITAGTMLPCVLQTALNSTQPGYTTCLIPSDVFSDNGNVVLMEKGTKVLGEYRGGISQGQNRLFILWTRAVTPRGVAIDLGSPASDALGRGGVAGSVDTHFWDRFGGALLLSLIDDGMQAAGQALANRGSNTTQVPSDAAGIALQNSIGIKPVLKKNQGEEVGIFVAQDFNFADVYDLRLRR